MFFKINLSSFVLNSFGLISSKIIARGCTEEGVCVEHLLPFQPMEKPIFRGEPS